MSLLEHDFIPDWRVLEQALMGNQEENLNGENLNFEDSPILNFDGLKKCSRDEQQPQENIYFMNGDDEKQEEEKYDQEEEEGGFYNPHFEELPLEEQENINVEQHNQVLEGDQQLEDPFQNSNQTFYHHQQEQQQPDTVFQEEQHNFENVQHQQPGEACMSEAKDFETVAREFDEAQPFSGGVVFLTTTVFLDLLAELFGWKPISNLNPAISESKSYECSSFKITVHGNRTVRKCFRNVVSGEFIEVATVTNCTSEQIRDLFRNFAIPPSPQKKRRVEDTPVEESYDDVVDYVSTGDGSIYNNSHISGHVGSNYSDASSSPQHHIQENYPPRKKRKIVEKKCYFFLQGYCRFGENCHFSHEI